MNISFEIPHEIEQRIQTDGNDLNREAKEAFLIEQYRQDKISHGQLADALGLDAYETDGVLKKHGVTLEITAEELREEALSLRDVRPK